MKRIVLSVLTIFLLVFVGCTKNDERAEAKKSAETRTDADNTGRNVRDRNEGNLTSDDQSGTEADRTITQQIRKAVMDDDSLSTMAKNVKIITVNGVVTLRGPVKSEAEKAKIGDKAKQVAGVKSVDNQLEVEVNK